MREGSSFSSESKVDLHVHTVASTDVGSEALRQLKIGGESYTDPRRVYDVARMRGMDFVTISDHNTLDGALRIAHLPDTFLSEEITTRFPNEDVILHVLAWGLNEEDHRDLQQTRGSVIELVEFLQERNIAHGLAHPLYRMGAAITPDHVEKAELLFDTWEGRNGARTEKSNTLATSLAERVTPEHLERLANKHGIESRHTSIRLTGGSDDHGGLDIATTWTEAKAKDVNEFLEALRSGKTRPDGEHGSTRKLAQALVSVGLDELQRSGHQLPANVAPAVKYLFKEDAQDSAERHGQISLAAKIASGKLAEKARKGISRGDLAQVYQQTGGLALAAALQVPSLFAANHHASSRLNLRNIEEAFFGTAEQSSEVPRALIFTDTFEETNGVAGTMRRLTEAAGKGELPLTVVTVGEQAKNEPGLAMLQQEWDMKIPLTDNSVRVPNITEVLALVEAEDPDVIHVTTPGPVGLAGLIAAKLLGIPTVGSYHTELGPYALQLTKDMQVGHPVSWYVDFFYKQCGIVSAPTDTIADSLRQRKIGEVDIWGRGVDTDLFNPAKRNEALRSKLLGEDGETLILSVGRLSKEKRLDVLLEAFKTLHSSFPGARLAIVGNGPQREELERTKPDGVLLLGEMHDEDLAKIYASADIFGFPSTTDTFGQVILEAGASGLPVVAARAGGAPELLEDGRTGILTTPDNPVAMAMAFLELLTDQAGRAEMGRQAREVAEQRTWQKSHDELLRSYRRGIELAGNELLKVYI